MFGQDAPRDVHCVSPTASRRLRGKSLVHCAAVFLTCVCCITALAQDDEQAFSDDSPPSESAANKSVADLLQEATLHAIGGAYGEAEKCYRQILERTGSDDPASAKATIVLADLIERQGRKDEGAKLLLSALQQYRPKLGDQDPTIKRMLQMAARMCNEYAWNKSIEQQGAKEDYDRAVELVQQAAELNQENSMRSLLGLARLRQGDLKGSLEAMNRSLGNSDEDWIGQWLIMAMAQLANGNQQAAKDWYVAASDRIAGTNNSWAPNLRLQAEMATKLGLDPAWPPQDWSDEKCLESLDRLVASWPDNINLRYSHGFANIRVKNWEAARLDCERILEALCDRIEKAPENKSLLPARQHVRQTGAVGQSP